MSTLVALILALFLFPAHDQTHGNFNPVATLDTSQVVSS